MTKEIRVNSRHISILQQQEYMNLRDKIAASENCSTCIHFKKIRYITMCKHPSKNKAVNAFSICGKHTSERKA